MNNEANNESWIKSLLHDTGKKLAISVIIFFATVSVAKLSNNLPIELNDNYFLASTAIALIVFVFLLVTAFQDLRAPQSTIFALIFSGVFAFVFYKYTIEERYPQLDKIDSPSIIVMIPILENQDSEVRKALQSLQDDLPIEAGSAAASAPIIVHEHMYAGSFEQTREFDRLSASPNLLSLVQISLDHNSNFLIENITPKLELLRSVGIHNFESSYRSYNVKNKGFFGISTSPERKISFDLSPISVELYHRYTPSIIHYGYFDNDIGSSFSFYSSTNSKKTINDNRIGSTSALSRGMTAENRNLTEATYFSTTMVLANLYHLSHGVESYCEIMAEYSKHARENSIVAFDEHLPENYLNYCFDHMATDLKFYLANSSRKHQNSIDRIIFSRIVGSDDVGDDLVRFLSEPTKIWHEGLINKCINLKPDSVDTRDNYIECAVDYYHGNEMPDSLHDHGQHLVMRHLRQVEAQGMRFSLGTLLAEARVKRLLGYEEQEICEIAWVLVAMELLVDYSQSLLQTIDEFYNQAQNYSNSVGCVQAVQLAGLTQMDIRSLSNLDSDFESNVQKLYLVLNNDGTLSELLSLARIVADPVKSSINSEVGFYYNVLDVLTRLSYSNGRKFAESFLKQFERLGNSGTRVHVTRAMYPELQLVKSAFISHIDDIWNQPVSALFDSTNLLQKTERLQTIIQDKFNVALQFSQIAAMLSRNFSHEKYADEVQSTMNNKSSDLAPYRKIFILGYAIDYPSTDLALEILELLKNELWFEDNSEVYFHLKMRSHFLRDEYALGLRSLESIKEMKSPDILPAYYEIVEKAIIEDKFVCGMEKSFGIDFVKFIITHERELQLALDSKDDIYDVLKVGNRLIRASQNYIDKAGAENPDRENTQYSREFKESLLNNCAT